MVTYYSFTMIEMKARNVFFRRFEVSGLATLHSFANFVCYIFGCHHKFEPAIIIEGEGYADPSLGLHQLKDATAVRLNQFTQDQLKTVHILYGASKYVFVGGCDAIKHHRGNRYCYIYDGAGAGIFEEEYRLYTKMLKGGKVTPKYAVMEGLETFDCLQWNHGFKIDRYRSLEVIQINEHHDEFLDCLYIIDHMDLSTGADVALFDNIDDNIAFLDDPKKRYEAYYQYHQVVAGSDEDTLPKNIASFVKKNPWYFPATLEQIFLLDDFELSLERLEVALGNYLKRNHIQDNDLIDANFLSSDKGYYYLYHRFYIDVASLRLGKYQDVIWDIEAIKDILFELPIGRNCLLPILSAAYLLQHDYEQNIALRKQLDLRVLDFDDAYIEACKGNLEEAYELASRLSHININVAGSLMYGCYKGYEFVTPISILEGQHERTLFDTYLYFIRMQNGFEPGLVNLALFGSEKLLDSFNLSDTYKNYLGYYFMCMDELPARANIFDIIALFQEITPEERISSLIDPSTKPSDVKIFMDECCDLGIFNKGKDYYEISETGMKLQVAIITYLGEKLRDPGDNDFRA